MIDIIHKKGKEKSNNHSRSSEKKILYRDSFILITSETLLLRILLPNPPLHSRPLRNPINPLKQMREWLHILGRETRELPALDPGPGADVRDAVLAFAVAGEVFARRAGVFARELDLEDAVDAEGFVAEAVDGVWGGVVSLLLFVVVVGKFVREGGETVEEYVHGIFSFANFPKWLTCPWYGAPLPCW